MHQTRPASGYRTGALRATAVGPSHATHDHRHDNAPCHRAGRHDPRAVVEGSVPQRRCCWWIGSAGRRYGRRSAAIPVRVCVGGRLVASRFAPELRVCGSDSAKYGPPIALDLGKREMVVGRARTTSVGCNRELGKRLPARPAVKVCVCRPSDSNSVRRLKANSASLSLGVLLTRGPGPGRSGRSLWPRRRQR